MGRCNSKPATPTPPTVAGTGTLLLTDEYCLAGARGSDDARLSALLSHLYYVAENDPQFAGVIFSSDVSSPSGVSALAPDAARVHDKRYAKGVCKAIAAAVSSGVTDKLNVPGVGALRGSALRAMGGSAHLALRGIDSLCLPSNKQSQNVLGLTSGSGHRTGIVGPPKGYSVLNSPVMAAAYARARYGLSRVAVVDVGPHPGQGSLELAAAHGLFYAATLLVEDEAELDGGKVTRAGGTVLARPLPWDATGDEFRGVWEGSLLPKLAAYAPELIVFSVGFPDAEGDDRFYGGAWEVYPDDYHWLTVELMAIANASAQGRILALLEDGVHVDSVLDFTTMIMYAFAGAEPPEAAVVVEEEYSAYEYDDVEEEVEKEPTPEPEPEPTPSPEPESESDEEELTPEPTEPSFEEEFRYDDDYDEVEEELDPFIDPRHTFLDLEIGKQTAINQELEERLAHVENTIQAADAHEAGVEARLAELEARLDAERATLEPMRAALAPHTDAMAASVHSIDDRVARAHELTSLIQANKETSAHLRELIEVMEARVLERSRAAVVDDVEARDREAVAVSRTRAEIAEVANGTAVLESEIERTREVSKVIAAAFKDASTRVRGARLELSNIDDDVMGVYDNVEAKRDFVADTKAVKAMRMRELDLSKDTHINLLEKKADRVDALLREVGAVVAETNEAVRRMDERAAALARGKEYVAGARSGVSPERAAARHQVALAQAQIEQQLQHMGQTGGGDEDVSGFDSSGFTDFQPATDSFYLDH